MGFAWERDGERREEVAAERHDAHVVAEEQAARARDGFGDVGWLLRDADWVGPARTIGAVRQQLLDRPPEFALRRAMELSGLILAVVVKDGREKEKDAAK